MFVSISRSGFQPIRDLIRFGRRENQKRERERAKRQNDKRDLKMFLAVCDLDFIKIQRKKMFGDIVHLYGPKY